MKIELLYLYIGENNTSVKDVGICFSHEYRVEFKDKLLKIERMEGNIYKDFYGKYIKSCSLIVGKNGSGKSTLLNFLGLLSDNLNKYYLETSKRRTIKASQLKSNCNELGCWFALYSIDEQFYIEGYNFERLFDYKEIFGYMEINENIISSNFGLFIEYDFVSNCMTLKKIASNSKITNIDFYYYKKTANPFSIDFENSNISKLYHEDSAGQDYRIALNRREIFSANVNNIYKLFEKYSDLLFDKDFGSKAKIILEIEGLSSEYSDEFNQFIESKLQFSIKQNFGSSKKTYITKLYYKLAFGLWDAYFREHEESNKEINLKIKRESKNIYKDIALCYLDDIRTNYYEDIPDYNLFLEKFVGFLEGIDDKYFTKGGLIQIPLTQHDTNVQKVLDYYYTLVGENSLRQVVRVKYADLSSGEHEYIEVFGSIIKIISEIDHNACCKDRILLLDEPDRTFHPEWTSNYIYKLIQILNKYGEIKGISFQIIITTHSPFMVSDILKDDIYKIENKDGNIRVTNSEYGFASNYYDIMKDTFFLSNSVGEFAKHKIEYIKHKIEEAKSVVEILEMNKYINAIGDEYIRTILNIIYKKRISEISSKTDELSMERIIRQKEDELKFLRGLYNKHE